MKTNTTTAPHPRPRTGKTAKDRASGATARRLTNRAMRVEWEHDPKRVSFPKSACNGKKNLSRYTGACNITVTL